MRLSADAIRRAAFLTFLLVVFVFQTDRLAAVRAEFRAHGIESSAVVAENFRRIERVNL
jgi:hypothetical protein